jgi:hypothetical protein
MSTQQNIQALRESFGDEAPLTPLQQRVKDIRCWHVNRGTGDLRTVAMAHIGIMSDGSIMTDGLHLDRVHAQIMIGSLDALRERLVEIAAGSEDDSTGSVVPLHRAV